MGVSYSWFKPTPTTYQLTCSGTPGIFGWLSFNSSFTPPFFLVSHPISQLEWTGAIDKTNFLMGQVDRRQRFFSFIGIFFLGVAFIVPTVSPSSFVMVAIPFLFIYSILSTYLMCYRNSTVIEINALFSSWVERGVKVNFYLGDRRRRRCLGFDYAMLAAGDSQNPAFSMTQEERERPQKEEGLGVIYPQQGGSMNGFNPQMKFNPQIQQMKDYGQQMQDYGQQQQHQQYGQQQPQQQMQYNQQQQPPQQIPVAYAQAPPLQAPMSKPQVQVQVPIYGGGGPSMVEWNGTYISVEIPKDAFPESFIMVDVPDRYL